jgi:hypothetical protein
MRDGYDLKLKGKKFPKNYVPPRKGNLKQKMEKKFVK